MMSFLRPMVAAALLTAPLAVSAQITIFTNQATFLSQLSGAQTDNFSSLPTGTIPGPINRTVGAFSYRASTGGSANFFNSDPFGNPTGFLSVNPQNESITFDNITSSVRAFGGNFFGSNAGNLTNMTLDIIATTASGSVTQRLVNPGFSSFVGFISTQSFTSIRAQWVSGNFTTADNVVIASTVVPEPSTYALLAAGLVVMGVVARRRRA